MVSVFNIVFLYIIGIFEVLFPLLTLFFLHRYKKYFISSAIAGFACYFIVNSMVLNGISTIFLVAMKDAMYFQNHSFIATLFNAAITALVLVPAEYLVIKIIRKGKWGITDAMALAVGYSLIPMLQEGALSVSGGSLCRYANNGQLETLVSEEWSLESIEALVKGFSSSTKIEMVGQLLIVIITQIVVILSGITVALLLFYAVKRVKKSFIFIAILFVFADLMITSGPIQTYSYWLSLGIMLVWGAGCGYFIYRFMMFYRQQQIELKRKKEEFKRKRHEQYLAEQALKLQQKKEAEAAAKKAAELAVSKEDPQA